MTRLRAFAERPLVGAAAAGAAATFVAAVAYRMTTRAGLRTPLVNTSDELFYDALTMVLQRNTWLTTAELGAPNGFDLVDFPQSGDNLNLLLLKLVSFLPVGPFAATNLYMLAGFAIIATVTVCVLRAVGLRPLTAAAGGFLFALAPYHFGRFTAHLFLANYVSVPLLLLLLHWLVDDGLVQRPLPRRRLLGLVAIALVVGSCGIYYAVFSVLLLLAAGALQAVRDRAWRPVLATVAVVGAIGVVVVANMSPHVLNDRREGANTEAASRPLSHTEAFGLRVAGLLTPGDTHRIGAFEALGESIEAVAEPGETGKYLGLVAAAGATGLVVLTVARVAGNRDRTRPLVGMLGALTIVTILVATKGGVSMVLAATGAGQIRAWGRMGIIIGLFGLVAAGLAFDRARPRLAGWRSPAVLAAVVAVAVLDQVPPFLRFDIATLEATLSQERDYVTAVQDTLPDGSLVYQAPYMRFPESPAVEGINSYEPMRLPLVGDGSLRWSYGAMRGREGQWEETLIGLDPADLAPVIAAAGFDGLSVDMRGFPGQGVAAAAAIAEDAGPAVVVSESGLHRFFDLRDLRAELAGDLDDPDEVAAAIVGPPRLNWLSGVGPHDERYPAGRTLEDVVVIAIDNDGGGVAPARLLGSVQVAPGATITLDYEGETYDLDPELGVELEVPEGRSEGVLRIEGPPLAGGVAGLAEGVVLVDRRADPLWELLGLGSFDP